MASRIFVYGSLRTGSGHAMAAWLAAHAVPEGAGRVQGRLYRVSWYPALVVAEGDAASWVQGELFRLPAPALLAELDAYEEVRGQPDDEYRRERVTVWRDGRPAEAWAWVWQREVGGLLRVPGGDWLQQA
ncbi:MAG: gamma-glutamylcyclotransferase [Moraxellaceae bacterium]